MLLYNEHQQRTARGERDKRHFHSPRGRASAIIITDIDHGVSPSGQSLWTPPARNTRFISAPVCSPVKKSKESDCR